MKQPQELPLFQLKKRALAAESVLQSNIDLDETARITAVSDEATLRTNADNTLQSNIDSEAATRLANDTTLQNNID